jgi:hypothetical protein
LLNYVIVSVNAQQITFHIMCELRLGTPTTADAAVITSNLFVAEACQCSTNTRVGMSGATRMKHALAVLVCMLLLFAHKQHELKDWEPQEGQ